jgi:AraC-like DNA-binding protein
VGLRFQPGAALGWLGTSAAEIVDARIPLERFWGAEARSLADWLAEAASPEHSAERLEAVLGGRISAVEPDDFGVAVFRILSQELDSEVAVTRRLRERLGLSERTIRRRCNEIFGFGPKTIDRILRFQRFIDLAGKWPSTQTDDLAANAGYFDQSHLAREARELANLTPRTVRAQLTSTTESPQSGENRRACAET